VPPLRQQETISRFFINQLHHQTRAKTNVTVALAVVVLHLLLTQTPLLLIPHLLHLLPLGCHLPCDSHDHQRLAYLADFDQTMVDLHFPLPQPVCHYY